MQTKTKSIGLLRAAGSSYLVLCSIWFLLGSWCFWMGMQQGVPGAMDIAFLCLSVGLVTCGWLCGFKIIVTDTHFEYRGGNYITKKIPLAEIGRIAHAWVEWERFGGPTKIPRLVVITRDRKAAVVINSKPFKLQELQDLAQQLEQLDGYDSKLQMKGKIKVTTWRMFFDFICVAVAVLSLWCAFMGLMHLTAAY